MDFVIAFIDAFICFLSVSQPDIKPMTLACQGDPPTSLATQLGQKRSLSFCLRVSEWWTLLGNKKQDSFVVVVLSRIVFEQRCDAEKLAQPWHGGRLGGQRWRK